MQRQGSRGDRGNSSSTYIPNDTGCRSKVSARQEHSGPNHTETSAGLLLSVHHRTESNAAPLDTNASVTHVDGFRSVSIGSSSHEHASQVSTDNIIDFCQRTSVTDVNKLVKRPVLRTVAVKQLPDLNPGPTPTPMPTRSGHLSTKMNSTPVSGVYSYASDSVLLPSLNPWNPRAVGAVKCETGNQQSAVEIIGSSSESMLNPSQDVRNSGEAGTEAINRSCQGVEKSHHPEPKRPHHC